MIVLDACVLIAHLRASDPHRDRATALLLASADETFGASSLTLAEVLVGPARKGKLTQAQRALRDLEVAEIPLPGDSPAKIAELRVNGGLRLPDCCVLLAAATAGAGIATFDDRLRKTAVKLGHPLHD